MKPGRVNKVLEGKHSHLNQASPGRSIDVSYRAELGHIVSIDISDGAKPGRVEDQSHSIDVSDQVEPRYVDNQSPSPIWDVNDTFEPGQFWT